MHATASQPSSGSAATGDSEPISGAGASEPVAKVGEPEDDDDGASVVTTITEDTDPNTAWFEFVVHFPKRGVTPRRIAQNVMTHVYRHLYGQDSLTKAMGRLEKFVEAMAHERTPAFTSDSKLHDAPLAYNMRVIPAD